MIMPSAEKTAPSFQFSSHMRCGENQSIQTLDEAPVWLQTFRPHFFCVTYPDLPIEPTEHTCTHRYLPVRFTTCADACVATTTANVPTTQNSIFIGSSPPIHGSSLGHVRFTPECGHSRCARACPLCPRLC